MLKASTFIQQQANCTVQQILTTRIPFLMNAGSATIITTKHNVKMAMSSLFSFVPCRGTYQLLQTCVKYAGGMLDGGMIGAIFNDNIQNENMIFPPPRDLS